MKRSQLQTRINVLMALVGTFFLILVAQMFRLQIQNKKVALAASSTIATQERGSIVDRNGNLLAVDLPRWTLSATPRNIRPKDRADVAAKLSRITGIPASEIMEKLKKSSPEYAPLATDLPWEVGLQIKKEFSNPNVVTVRLNPKRMYPQGKLASEVLGSVWEPKGIRRGVYGVEETYDEFLRKGGTWPGIENQKPEPLPDQYRTYLPSAAGHDLILTIDRAIQFIAEDELRKGVEYFQAEKGMAVVMDPHTGEILAMATYPHPKTRQPSPVTFEPFEPGSVFKIITAAAALDSNTITTRTAFTDTGRVIVSGRIIRNWDGRAYGRVTINEVLVNSLNVEAAKISLEMGPGTFYNYLRRFGFGEKTEVDIAPEQSGVVHWPGDKLWNPLDMASSSYGQALETTVLQMTTAVAAVANGGNLVRPHALYGLVNDGNLIRYRPPLKRGRIIKKKTAKTLTDLLVASARIGGHDMIPGYPVAGKTGTAEIAGKHGYTLDVTNASFVGYVPAYHPKIICMVTIEKPKRSIWAERVAAPVFQHIAERTLEYLQVPPETQAAGIPTDNGNN